MVWCTSCGVELRVGQKYCAECGTKVLSELQSNTTQNGAGGTLQLSQGALQSLVKIRERYEKTGQAERKKKVERLPETVSIGAAILDKNKKIVKKAFGTAVGLISNLTIKVGRNSTEEKWVEEVEQLFQGNMNFQPLIPTDAGFCSPNKKLTIEDLNKYRKEKKHKQLRLFLWAEGKEKKDIKKCFKGINCLPDKTPSSDEDEEKEVDIRKLIKRQKCETSKEKEGKLQIQPLLEKKHQEDGKVIDVEEEEEAKMSSQGQLEKKHQEDGKVIDVEEEEEAKMSSQGQDIAVYVTETVDKACGTEPFQKCSPCEPEIDVDFAEDDVELERFMKLQAKLEERKQFLFDVVCSKIEVAPKFHMVEESSEVKITTDHTGPVENLKKTLFIIEEEYNQDETITNYDEVFFQEEKL